MIALTCIIHVPLLETGTFEADTAAERKAREEATVAIALHVMLKQNLRKAAPGP